MRWYRSFKIAFGFILALTVASFFKLSFPISAGIVTMLNLLDTKKASAKVAWRRLYASAIGLCLDYVFYTWLGLHTWVMVIAVVLFIPIAFRIKAREGMAIHVVLTSHFLIYQDISFFHLGQEYLLVIIGASIALLLNLHMPNKEPVLIKIQSALEVQMRMYILSLAFHIKSMCFVDHEELTIEAIEEMALEGRQVAFEFMSNFYIKNQPFYLDYFQMRLEQINRLKYIHERMLRMIFDTNEARIISAFTEDLAEAFDLKNDGSNLLKAVQRLQQDLREMNLPQTHFEMEQKAYLLQYTSDLEEFIRIKRRFSKQYQETLLFY